MSEQLAPACGGLNQDTAFIIGLFSTLDAMMDRPLSELLGCLPLCPEISAALLDHQGPYAPVLNSVIAYERAEWDKLECPKTSMDTLAEIYLSSLEWADKVRNDIKADSR
jgi:EAL and modified HD-GYP domain-containing signal transduction protein